MVVAGGWAGGRVDEQYAGNVDAMAKWLRVSSLGYLAPEGLVEAATRSSGRSPPHLPSPLPRPSSPPPPPPPRPSFGFGATPRGQLRRDGRGWAGMVQRARGARRVGPLLLVKGAGASGGAGAGPTRGAWGCGVSRLLGDWNLTGRGGRDAALLLPGVLHRGVPRARVQGQGGLVACSMAAAASRGGGGGWPICCARALQPGPARACLCGRRRGGAGVLGLCKARKEERLRTGEEEPRPGCAAAARGSRDVPLATCTGRGPTCEGLIR